MKTMILLILKLLICVTLMAPAGVVSISMLPGDVIQPYEKLINAVVSVESGGDNYAYNSTERAYGAFQIRQVRLNDFNKKTGKRYKLIDMYDYSKAEEVFLYYCQGDYEFIAKSWNGSGPKTIDYWEKIQKHLINSKTGN